MKSEIKILHEILPSTIEDQELCWAASIEMVFKNQIDQNHLEELVNQYKIDAKIHKFPNDMYYKLFNENYLQKCGCTQFRFSSFLSPEYIKAQIKKEQPIIISGISYPIFYKKHTFVVKGFKSHLISGKEIFWVLALDPRAYTYKVAWVYDELIKFQKNKKNKYDFITNVGKRNEFIDSTNSVFSQEMEYSIPRKKLNYYWTSSIISTENFLNYILKSKENLFTKFFNLLPTDIKHIKKICKSKLVQKNIRYRRMNDAFKESNQELHFYPLMNASSTVVLLEFIYLQKFGKLKLIGIQESDLLTRILAIRQFQKGVKSYELDHELINYDIYEFKNFRLLKIKNEDIFTPEQDYGQLKVGNGYTIHEIKNNL